MSGIKQQARMERAAIENLPRVTREIDWGALDRIAAYAAQARAEMGPERWAELQKEWEQ
jgi:hypothetical protein